MAVFVFRPIADGLTKDTTATNVTTAAASASTAILGNRLKIKCLTNPAYIRLGSNDITVSATNGFYMAVGDVVDLDADTGVTHLAYIRVGSDGALSILWAEGE